MRTNPNSTNLKRVARSIVTWGAIYIVMVGLGALMQIRASDWYIHFQPRFQLYDYPPWLAVLLALLPALPFLSGLTMTGLLYALWRRQAQPIHLLAAFTAMPVFWVLWLGQIDVVPLLGLSLLPWGIPLVLLKPQVGVWYLWAWWRARPNKWKIATGTLMFLALTMVIWGPWPFVIRPPATIDLPTNLSLWHVGWPLGALAVLGALIDPDPDRAMALGALAAPYLQGASYLVLLPALARLRGWRLAGVWLTTWTSLLVIPLGDRVRPLAILFPLSLWLALYFTDLRSRAMSVSKTKVS
jgi:hypothetical protein